MVTQGNEMFGVDWLEKSSHAVPGMQCHRVEEEPCQGLSPRSSLLGDTLLRVGTWV